MEFLYPLTAIASEAASNVLDKANYAKNRIATHHLMRLVFFCMAASLFIYILLSGVPLPQFSWVGLGLMSLIVAISFTGNLLDYVSLRNNNLSVREPLVGFEPVLASFFGQLFFPAERKGSFLIAIGLSFLIVYFGIHKVRLGKRQRRGLQYLLLAILLYSLLPSIYSFALPYINPEYLTFFRVAIIGLLAVFFLRVKRHKKSFSKTAYGVASGVLGAVAAVASLYAIQALGVTQTMLLLLLAPALMYISAYFLFKERVQKNEIVSSLALVAVVLSVTFI